MTMRILLVEDNPADVMIAQRAFHERGIENEMQVVRDGREALDYLRGQGAYGPPGAAPPPDLVLLDLNLPGMNGGEVLEQIKRDPALCAIPVVVLTTSDSEEDIARAYRSGANTYIQKPVDFDTFVEVVGALQHYWTDVAKLPPH